MNIPPIATVTAALLVANAASVGSDNSRNAPSGWKTLKAPGKPATEFRAAPNGAITRAFGCPPPKARTIALSVDTDDKRGMSMGKVADLNIHAE